MVNIKDIFGWFSYPSLEMLMGKDIGGEEAFFLYGMGSQRELPHLVSFYNMQLRKQQVRWSHIDASYKKRAERFNDLMLEKGGFLSVISKNCSFTEDEVDIIADFYVELRNYFSFIIKQEEMTTKEWDEMRDFIKKLVVEKYSSREKK